MYYKKNGIEISSQSSYQQLSKFKTKIESPVRIAGMAKVNIGSIGAFTFFRGGMVEELESIGRFCSVAPNVCIGPIEHDIRLLTTSPFINSWLDNSISNEYWDKNKVERIKALSAMREIGARNRQSVTIGNDVWVGQNVVIRKGVKVGNGAVIAANSVVSKDVEPYEIVGGVPAHHIRYRFTIEQIKILERTKWWSWSLDSLHNLSWSDIDIACNQLQERHNKNNFTIPLT